MSGKRRRAPSSNVGHGAPALSAPFGASESCGSLVMQWTEKYAPCRRKDLVIRKNKVEEFVAFLESRSPPTSPVCILSGGSGCGKSTLVRVIAKELGMEVVEYVAKVQQQRVREAVGHPDQARHGSYESKLDSYESFCSRAWMNTLESADSVPGSASDPKQRRNLVVLDDIPTVVGEDQERRLVNATLGLVMRSSKVVLIVTELSSKDTAEHCVSGGRWESSSVPKALTLALEKFCNPLAISLNPVPKPTMVKHLGMICDREGVALSKEDLQLVADHSQGDLSSAILSLQFAAFGLANRVGKIAAAQRRGAGRRRGDPPGKQLQEGSSAKVLSHLVRDTSLSLFHGLGKLLYNKRLPYNTSSDGRSELDRPPMDGFDPEETVHLSGLSGPSVTAFLHENILDFVDAEHIEDVAQCMDHISRADVLSSKMDSTPYFGTAQDEPDGTRGLQDMLSSIVASRGVCYWNSHPAPRSWKPLKAPVSFRVERARRTNSARVRLAASVNRIEHGRAIGQTTCQCMAIEVLPFVRIMGHKDVRQQPQKWDRYWQGECVECVNWREKSLSTPTSDTIFSVEAVEDPIEN